jgi:hypothetical protein
MKKAYALLIITIAAAVLYARPALADVVYLKDGGKIEGTVEVKGDKTVVTVKEGMVVTLDSKDVLRIEKKKSSFEEYKEKLETLDEKSADGWYALGLWCKERGLSRESEEAFGRVLGINPEHEAAHLALGHKLVDGRWLTQDEVNVSKGLVKHKGAWVTAERKAELEAEESRRDWKRKVRLLADAIKSGKESEGVVAQSALLSIRDKNAVSALIGLLDNPEARVRILVCRTLAFNPSPETFAALQKAALHNNEEDVRAAAAAALKNLDGHSCWLEFIRAYLYDESADVRSRALEAIVILKDKRSVAVLIELLVVEVKNKSASEGFETKGFVGAKEFRVISYREFTDATGRKFKVPVMARVGGSSDDGSTERAEDVFNPMLREALMKITGVNFNFDQDKWREWWKENNSKFDMRMNPVKQEAPAPGGEKK